MQMARRSGSAFTSYSSHCKSRGLQLCHLAQLEKQKPATKLQMLVRLEMAASAQPIASVSTQSIAAASAQPIAAASTQSIAAASAQPIASASVQPIASASAQPIASASAKAIVPVPATRELFYHHYHDGPELETLSKWMTEFKHREVKFHPEPMYWTHLANIRLDGLVNKIEQNDLPPSVEDRSIVLHWLQSTAADLKIERQTVQLAANAIDRILALDVRRNYATKKCWITRGRFQLLATACLWTLYKSEEDGDLRCEEFAVRTGGACTVKTMIEMEEFVCRSLDFRWHAATIDDALTFLLQHILHLLHHAAEMQESMTTTTTTTTATRKEANLKRWQAFLTDVELFWRVSVLGDLALLDMQSLLHFPSAIAASILINEFQFLPNESDRNNLITLVLCASDYALQTLHPCLQWIQSIRQHATGSTVRNNATSLSFWKPLPAEATQEVRKLNLYWSFRLQLEYPNSLAVVQSLAKK